MRRLVLATTVLVAMATFGLGGPAQAASSAPAPGATPSAMGARIRSDSQWTLYIPDWLATGCTIISFEGRQFYDNLADAGIWRQNNSSVVLVVKIAGAPTPFALGRGKYYGRFHKNSGDYFGNFRGRHVGGAPGKLVPGANPDCGP